MKNQEVGSTSHIQKWEKSIPENIRNILSHLPTSPGVYQMKDATGKVIYVGKAKSLKSRVKSYFDRTADLSAAKKQMVAQIRDIETILCATEVEALVLETNLIKHLTPKYNILMKDDKNLAYIKITPGPIPMVTKTRQKISDGGLYYGPYVSAVEQCVRYLRKVFRVRNCRVRFARSASGISIADKAWKTIPCMDYYIGLCPAPCLLTSWAISQHEQHLASLSWFLDGDRVQVFADLDAKMREHAKNLEFEEAGNIKTLIESLQTLGQRQSVRDVIQEDTDIVLFYTKYDCNYIAMTQIRRGQIIGVFRHEVESRFDLSEDEILEHFLTDQYWDDADIPEFLFLQKDIISEPLRVYIREKNITIEIPKIGKKRELVDFTLHQVREYAYKLELQRLSNRTLTREHMKNVLTKIGYDVPKTWEIVFECYDISHTDGNFTYASRVVIVDGKPDPSRYKKYKIKSLPEWKIDDFASHREVMVRRTLEGIEQDNFPDLIIIDGGKWQLSSAISGIKEGIWKSQQEFIDPILRMRWTGTEWSVVIQISENKENGLIHPKGTYDPVGLQRGTILQQIPICSIAKREEEIFLPDTSKPVIFEHGTPELMVLQKARDESHRFSITANRSARTKAMKKNILEELPGIGPVTRKKLLKLAGSVDGIREIALEQIEKICTKAQIETLRDHWIIS